MAADAEDDAARHPTPRPRIDRTTALMWSAVGVLVLVAFIAAIGALQRDVYSPRALVIGYLNALAEHDSHAALAFPGVELTPDQLAAAGLPRDASHELLRDDVLGHLGNITVRSDLTMANGEHRITADFRLGSAKTDAHFTVEQSGSVAGIFELWRFAASPLAVHRITVEHADTFGVGRLALNTRATDPSQADSFTTHANYLVFTPAMYRLSSVSKLVAARSVTVTLTSSSRLGHTVLDVLPTQTFVDDMRDRLKDFLDQCTRQQVLEPTGCPFGVQIDDRIEGVPAWTIAAYPPVSIVAGARGWRMESASGTAHIVVTVQSLFDGSITHRSTDEPFTVPSTAIELAPGSAPRASFG